MSERNKTHNGRGVGGQFKVRAADVEDLVTDPEGEHYLRDDIRLGGAVVDTGPHAGSRGAHIAELVEENRENIGKIVKKI